MINYEFRKLCADDIFPMCTLISKIGIKEFKSCFESNAIKGLIGGEGDVEVVGAAVFLDVAGVVLANLEKCKKEIYTMLSNVSGLKVEEISTADITDFAEMIVAFIQKDELKDFIKVVSKFIK